MGFGQGLSGLNAASQELDVIGNNIANAGTVGFKASTVAFADIYATSKVGLGTKVAAVNQRFTAGNITTTGNQLDLAVDGSAGMFRMQDALGNVMYTRNGQFFADSSNYIVNAQGQRLTGFGLTGTDTQPLRIPVGNLAPIASSKLTTQTNLNAKAPVVYLQNLVDVEGYVSVDGGAYSQVTYRLNTDTGEFVEWDAVSGAASPSDAASDTKTYTFASNSTGTLPVPLPATFTSDGTQAKVVAEVAKFRTAGDVTTHLARPFDPTVPESYTHCLPITVYDSLGNPQQLNQYFVKREASATQSEWDVYYTFNGKTLTSADPLNPLPHKMTFSQAGVLATGDKKTITIEGVGGAAAPAENLTLSFDYANSTSFSGDFAYNFTQDGFPTGEFSNIEVGRDGAVIAVYTNGERRTTGYVALADFNNLNGLQPVGDNAWVETGASGQPILGRPGTNGLALIRGQAVEESNVDMSQELVKMIISQRFYQANAQTIKTQDQVLQTLITLR